MVAGWARTMIPSSLGGRLDLREPLPSSTTTSPTGVVGLGAFIVISDKSSSGKVDATYLRKSSNPLP